MNKIIESKFKEKCPPLKLQSTWNASCSGSDDSFSEAKKGIQRFESVDNKR